VQLNRLRPAFEGCDLVFATVKESYRSQVGGARFAVIPDANRWSKVRLASCAFGIFRLVLRERPDVVVSTGAAPGYFAIRAARLLGKKTVWIDSIANAAELSLSGQKAGRHADLWLTQWEHLAKPDGPRFQGNVLGEAEKGDQRSDSSPPTSVLRPPRRLFVTVGTDLPFDRMVSAVDRWAGRQTNGKSEIFAQIGETKERPAHFDSAKFLEPPEFARRFEEADVIVAHAGMGTILTALSYQKPLLVMPRIAAKGEHRNEHQLATASRLSALNKVNVAADERELQKMLDRLDALPARDRIGPHAEPRLTNKLKEFIQSATR